MSRFPRADYQVLSPYDPGRSPVEVDLSDNTNLWGPHPAAFRVVRSATDEMLTRYPTVYADGLKQAVSSTFAVPVENVTTGCGSDDLLDSIFRAASPPGGTVTFPDPTFSMVSVFCHMNGLTPAPVAWDRAEADATALLEADPALVYLCRPNNPTGASLPEAWIDDLLAAVGDEGPLVAIDEAYADFGSGTLIGRAADHPRLVVLRTLSKAYGLAGLRVGFAVANARITAEAEKSRGPYKVNHLAALAASAAVLDEEGWVGDVVRVVKDNRARLAEALETLGFDVLPSDANFLLVPWRGPHAGERTLSELMERLRSQGVSVRPFPDLPGLGDTFRVTIGPWARMQRFLEVLEGVTG